MSRHTKLYEVLEVPPDADEGQIKKGFMKKARQFHPDKNPEGGEKFKEAQFAYEVLTDPEKRQIYDQFGEEGLKEGGGRGGGFDDDLFSFFGFPFGGQGQRRGGGGPPRKRKGKDVATAYPISLQDLYLGKQTKFQLTKSVICKGCKGKGASKPNAVTKCSKCGGSGVTVSMRNIGFGMIQQLQERCKTCGGEGEVLREKDRCKTCRGQKVMEETTVLDVFVEKGMSHGQKLVFKEEGDQHPDIVPGDVILVLQQKEHPIFTRDGDDLIIQKKIKLVEALCGFQFLITHLDGRSLLVKSKPDEIITPGDIKCIENEGMPIRRNPTQRGKLIIKFEIEFPKNGGVPPGAVKALEAVLPKPKPLGQIPADSEECFLSSFEKGQNGGSRRREAYGESDDSDDEDPRREGVACHQQ